jgi:membrane dipeptidase
LRGSIAVGGALVALLGAGLLLPCGVDRLRNGVSQAPGTPTAETLAWHRSLEVVDLHADPLLWSRDLLARAGHGHVDVPRLVAGGIAVQGFGVVTKTPFWPSFERTSGRTDMITALVMAQGRPPRTWGSLLARALDQAEQLRRAAAGSAGALRVLETRADLERLLSDRAGGSEAVGALLALEGLHALEGNLANVEVLYDAGFRMMGLTHFFDNEVAGSAHGEAKGGLSALGRQVLERIAALGVILDLAHASPRSVEEVLDRATAPVVVSHTGVAATCPGPRNLTDAQLRRIARGGGVVGIGFFPGAVCGEDVGAIVRAIHHAVAVVGSDHVALGSDWDGAIRAPFDAEGLPVLTEALRASGLDGATLRKIAGENALRVMREVLPSGPRPEPALPGSG